MALSSQQWDTIASAHMQRRQEANASFANNYMSYESTAIGENPRVSTSSRALSDLPLTSLQWRRWCEKTLNQRGDLFCIMFWITALSLARLGHRNLLCCHTLWCVVLSQWKIIGGPEGVFADRGCGTAVPTQTLGTCHLTCQSACLRDGERERE